MEYKFLELTLTVQEFLRQFAYKIELVASQLKQLFCYGKFSLNSNHLPLVFLKFIFH